jgi:transposase-like protein
MARRVYSDEEMARAYFVLETNQGNVRRTARDTGLPISTLRGWVKEWEASGPPDVSLVEAEATNFVERAERVRDKALGVLESKLDTATPSALVATVGMLQDKISLARGLATNRTETVHSLPPTEEIAKAL